MRAPDGFYCRRCGQTFPTPPDWDEYAKVVRAHLFQIHGIDIVFAKAS